MNHIFFSIVIIVVVIIIIVVIIFYRKSNLSYYSTTRTDFSVLLNSRTLLFVIPNKSRSLATMTLVKFGVLIIFKINFYVTIPSYFRLHIVHLKAVKWSYVCRISVMITVLFTRKRYIYKYNTYKNI